MFGRRKESGLVIEWQFATWDGTLGYAKNTEGMKKDDWDFSVELPREAEPDSVKLDFSGSSGEYSGSFTISYRIKDALAWRLIQLDEVSDFGNTLHNFRAHATLADLQNTGGAINHSPSSTLRL